MPTVRPVKLFHSALGGRRQWGQPSLLHMMPRAKAKVRRRRRGRRRRRRRALGRALWGQLSLGG